MDNISDRIKKTPDGITYNVRKGETARTYKTRLAAEFACMLYVRRMDKPQYKEVS